MIIHVRRLTMHCRSISRCGRRAASSSGGMIRRPAAPRRASRSCPPTAGRTCAGRRAKPAQPERTSTATWTAARRRRACASTAPAAQLDAVAQRRHPGDGLQPVGQLGDRVERAGEQEHRHDAEAHDRRERLVADVAASTDHAVIGPANAMPVSTRERHGRDEAPRAGRRGTATSTTATPVRGHRAAGGVPERRRRRRCQRGRSGVAAIARYSVRPREPVHHRPHRLLGDDDHRRRRQQAGARNAT